MKFFVVIIIAIIAVVASLVMVDTTPVLDRRAFQPTEEADYEKLEKEVTNLEIEKEKILDELKELRAVEEKYKEKYEKAKKAHNAEELARLANKLKEQADLIAELLAKALRAHKAKQNLLLEFKKAVLRYRREELLRLEKEQVALTAEEKDKLALYQAVAELEKKLKTLYVKKA
jgi:hypothetical protein